MFTFCYQILKSEIWWFLLKQTELELLLETSVSFSRCSDLQRSSEPGRFAHFPGVGHGPDASVHLFHGVHDVVECPGNSFLVSEGSEGFD